MTTIGVKLEKETRDRLKALGLARERSPHWLVKKAIEQYLEREEAWERELAEDRERWKEYELTGEAIPLDEMLEAMARARAGRKPKWPGSR